MSLRFSDYDFKPRSTDGLGWDWPIAYEDVAPYYEKAERFIGVVYRPGTERWSHYAEAALASQFDAWLWFEETSAVTPLPEPDEAGHQPGAWPFGL